MLRGVYPERNAGILRSTQNDDRRAQHDIPEEFFSNLLAGNAAVSSLKLRETCVRVKFETSTTFAGAGGEVSQGRTP